MGCGNIKKRRAGDMITKQLMAIYVSTTLFMMFLFVPQIAATPITIYVDGTYIGPMFDGTELHPYQFIWQGVDRATSGDTIYVLPASYEENIIIDTSSVRLIGEDKNTTIINGHLDEYSVTISANSVTIDSFTILGAITSGIYIESSGNTISGNIITHNQYGITHGEGASSNHIINNQITYNLETGISLHSTYGNLISDNAIINNYDYGIRITESGPNTIKDNTITECVSGILLLFYSNRNTIKENTIINNDENGIEISMGCYENDIFDNSIIGNSKGIKIGLKDPDGESYDNTIYHNNFIGNVQNAQDFHYNNWDNGIEGNFWDDYVGNDTNDDGIGEEHYEIPTIHGGSNTQDRYPFILQDGWNKRLMISAPDSVSENEDFDIIITTNLGVVENVEITFNQETYTTNSEGKVTITAPNVDENTNFEILATLEGYTNESETITVEDVISSIALVITMPFEVIENANFTVMVTANSEEISDVTITFNENSYTTDSNGEVIILAPSIQEDTEYELTATKEGYLPDNSTITVINQEEIEENGIINGLVYNSTEQPITNVTITTISSTTEYYTTTNDMGNYTLSVPPETYTIMASKQGYVTTTIHSINVEEGSYQELNIQLFKIENESEDGFASLLVENAIDETIQRDKLLAEVTFTPDTAKSPKIITYKDFEISNINQIYEKITFTINAPDYLKDEFLVIRIGDVFTSSNNIVFTFDGKTIEQVSFIELFNLDTEAYNDAAWTYVTATDPSGKSTDLIVVLVDHFSEHTISFFTLDIEVTNEVIQFAEIALIASIIVTIIAAVVVFRKGEEF